jgi:RNA polymerase sigma-70 factor (ECF subfamily)
MNTQIPSESIDVEDYYRKYGPMVLRRCRKILQEEGKAYEAMQDTFVRLLKHQSRLVHDCPSGLLTRISTRICLNVLRDQKRYQLLEQNAECDESQDEFSPSFDDIVQYDGFENQIIAKDILKKFFGAQPESTSVMAVMFYLDKMTYEEIAKEVNLSVSGVRKRLRGFNQKVKQLKEHV